MKLLKHKKQMLKSRDISNEMRMAIETIYKDKKRPMGKFNPWAWWVEIVRGCNLRCDFCPTRLFKKGYLEYMKKDVWVSLLKTIQQVTPRSRLEFCNAGEPTLHPDLIEYISIAREICPNLQLLTYTNGTQLINGNLTYKELFEAGLNMIFLDMYSPFKVHKKLAEKSGYYWFYQDNKPDDAPNIFQYQNDPEIHVIMLAENPYNWSKRKLGRGYLQTFFNDLDWPAASKFGMVPVKKAPSRRCDLPSKFININYDGTFGFCCFDYMRHSIDKFGNIKGGVDSFLQFWLGKYMQKTRKILFNKERNKHRYCSKCRFTSIRCDIPYWEEARLNEYYDGETMRKIK